MLFLFLLWTNCHYLQLTTSTKFANCTHNHISFITQLNARKHVLQPICLAVTRNVARHEIAGGGFSPPKLVSPQREFSRLVYNLTVLNS